MAQAKCRKCGGTATGNTFEEAASKINHASGLSRGIKCGSNYNCTIEIKDTKIPHPKVVSQEKPKVIPKEKPKPKTEIVSNSSLSPKEEKKPKS